MNTGSLLMMLGMVLLGVVGRIMTSQALDGAVYWSGLTIFVFSDSFIYQMIAKNIQMPVRMRRLQTIISKKKQRGGHGMTASVSVAPTVAQNLFTISMSFDSLLSLAPFGASLHLQCLSILYCSWQIWFSISICLGLRSDGCACFKKEPIFSRTAIIF